MESDAPDSDQAPFSGPAPEAGALVTWLAAEVARVGGADLFE